MSGTSQDYRLDVGHEQRLGRLAPRPASERLDVSALARLLRARAARPGLGRVVLGGGEPTLRADLLQVIATASEAAPGARVVLETDGLALGAEGPTRALSAAGLGGVRIPVVGARIPMHDWVMGVPGHGRRALRGVRTAAEVGLEVAVDCLLTRPSVPLLAETVAVVAKLGARAVRFRLVTPGEVPVDDQVALVARVGLVAGPLAEAVRTALRLGLAVEILGVPHCALPSELRGFAGVIDVETARCPSCSPSCGGVSADYVDLFGPAELLGGAREASVVRVVLGAPAPIRCSACGDGAQIEVEPRRDARVRLLRAARRQPERLRLASAGSLWHPAAPELLREAARLDVDHVEVAGDVAPLASWTDDELHRVRRLGAVHGAFYGPDAIRHDGHVGRDGAYEESRRALHRLSGLGVPVAGYGVLHGGADLVAWEGAWGPSGLPGAPAFRLSPAGSSLQELSEASRQLPDGAVRIALQSLLPACLRVDECAAPALTGGWSDEGEGRGGRPPSGSDRIGTWEPCPVAAQCTLAAVCPGLANGWTTGPLEAVA